MTTKKPTHLVVNRPPLSNETKEQMEKRAARFGLTSDDSSTTTTTTTRTTTTTKSVDSEQAAKLAARAARFADVKPSPDVKTIKKSTSSTTSGASSTVAATSVSTTASGAERDLLAKRAARFANVGTTK